MKKLLALIMTICIIISTPIYATADAVYSTKSAFPETRGSIYTFSLEYSTLYEWDSSMQNYNCYAYVLSLSATASPGVFVGEWLDPEATVHEVAELTRADLKSEAFNYQCVSLQYTLPESMNGWSHIIAVRKDTTYDLGPGLNDYHFAKLTTDGWLHKPSTTAVLKFNEAPSNAVPWTNEAYLGGLLYYAATITYESPIVYILYKSTHGNITYGWTGEHYHNGKMHYYEYANTCGDCGEEFNVTWISSPCIGSSCILPWGLRGIPQLN